MNVRSQEHGSTGLITCAVLFSREFCLTIDRFRCDTRFIDFDFAVTVGASLERSFLRPSRHRTLLSVTEKEMAARNS